MTRDDDQRFADILDAADQMAALVDRGKEVFADDFAVQLAMERLLEIIGEAATALTEEARSKVPSAPWRDITRLRIVLAHHYHRIDPEQVWQMATIDVPTLARALREAER